jgi:hypothetical protein
MLLPVSYTLQQEADSLGTLNRRLDGKFLNLLIQLNCSECRRKVGKPFFGSFCFDRTQVPPGH